MGRPTDPNFWQQSPPPQTGDMNNERTLNQRFMRELPGALPPQDVIIHDGAISGFESAALIVDTEGEAAADELNVINIVLSANENLHPGMIITLRAKDQARTVTVKNSAAANGVNTAGGHDVVLSTEWDLVLRLVAGRWYEIQTRGDVRASDAQTDASTALARTNPATTTSRGIARVATLADMEPGAEVENGPAFPDVQGGAITPTPTPNAVPQADASGKLDGWVSSDANKVNIDLDNISTTGKGTLFGLDQSWQDVTPSRTLGATYKNGDKKPILVSINYYYSTSAGELTFYINNVAHSRITGSRTYYGEPQFTEVTIPPQATYKVAVTGGAAGALTAWREYK